MPQSRRIRAVSTARMSNIKADLASVLFQVAVIDDLLAKKFGAPKKRLTNEESLTLIDALVKYSRSSRPHQMKELVNPKPHILVLGGNQSGKSTFINYFIGKKMGPMVGTAGGYIFLKNPDKSKLEHPIKVDAIVNQYERLFLKRNLQIAHDKYQNCPNTIVTESIFMEQCNHIVTDLRSPVQSGVFEIDVANSILFTELLSLGKKFKIVLLVSHKKLEDKKEETILELVELLLEIFGTTQNITKHKNSFAVIITNPPKDVNFVNIGKKFVCKTGFQFFDCLQIFSKSLKERIFLYDPLDRYKGVGILGYQSMIDLVINLTPYDHDA